MLKRLFASSNPLLLSVYSLQ